MQSTFSRLFVIALFTVTCSVNSYSNDIVLGIQTGPSVTKVFGKNTVYKPKADIRYAAADLVDTGHPTEELRQSGSFNLHRLRNSTRTIVRQQPIVVIKKSS